MNVAGYGSCYVGANVCVRALNPVHVITFWMSINACKHAFGWLNVRKKIKYFFSILRCCMQNVVCSNACMHALLDVHLLQRVHARVVLQSCCFVLFLSCLDWRFLSCLVCNACMHALHSHFIVLIVMCRLTTRSGGRRFLLLTTTPSKMQVSNMNSWNMHALLADVSNLMQGGLIATGTSGKLILHRLMSTSAMISYQTTTKFAHTSTLNSGTSPKHSKILSTLDLLVSMLSPFLILVVWWIFCMESTLCWKTNWWLRKRSGSNK